MMRIERQTSQVRWTTTGARHIALLACAAPLLATPLAAQQPWRSIDDFLLRGVALSPAQLTALSRGETVARVLPTTGDRDVAVFAAVQINVPRSFFIERQRDFARALKAPTRTHVQIFTDPASAANVQALDVDKDVVGELKSCRPGACTLKLPATDMDRLRKTIDFSAPDARSRVAAYARERMVEYVTDYRRRGNVAMVVYDDRGTVRSSDALTAMLADSSSVIRTVPSLARRLASVSRDTVAGASDVIFWSFDELPRMQRVLRITHQSIYSPPELPGTTMIAEKQIYADHYFEAGLELLGVVDRGAAAAGGEAAGITLVADRRYRFDNLPSGGLLNIRGRVTNGLRDNALADLQRLKRETEAAWAARRAGR